jgi:hypothetical protein
LQHQGLEPVTRAVSSSPITPSYILTARSET